MVDVKVDTENIEKKPESFFTQFDAVSFIECVRSVGIQQVKALVICIVDTRERYNITNLEF